MTAPAPLSGADVPEKLSLSLPPLPTLLLLVLLPFFFLWWPASASAHPGLDTELRLLTLQLKEKPHDAKLLYRRARLLIEHHEPQRARKDLHKLLTLRPTDARLKLLWIRLALAQQQWTTADEWLQRYSRCHRRGWRYWQWKARLEEKRRRPQQAISAYTQMFRIRWTPDAVLRRGRLQASLRQWTEAAKGYRAALHSMGSVVILEALVRLELRLHQWKRVEKRLLQTIKKAPVKIRWRLLLAVAKEGQKQKRQALSLRKLALKEAQELVHLRGSVLNRLQRLRVWQALGWKTKVFTECKRLLLLSTLQDLKQTCRTVVGKPSP